MIIQGKAPIEASVQDVWNHLMNPDVLEKITPGVSELIDLGDNKYKAISTIKIGLVKGNFEGQLELRDKIENKTAIIVVNQKSKIGNVAAEIKVQLNAKDDKAEIDYIGEAKLSGKLAMMGQRIIGGVVNSLSKQFFESLNNEIKEYKLKI